MKCLLFDNYDSFTYNLRHMLLELGLEVDVRRNDRITLDEVDAYDRIVLSPGPSSKVSASIGFSGSISVFSPVRTPSSSKKYLVIPIFTSPTAIFPWSSK